MDLPTSLKLGAVGPSPPKDVLFKIWYKETSAQSPKSDFCALKALLIFMSNWCPSRWVFRGFSQFLSFWSLHHSDHWIFWQDWVPESGEEGNRRERGAEEICEICFLLFVCGFPMKRSKIFWKESSSGTSTKLQIWLVWRGVFGSIPCCLFLLENSGPLKALLRCHGLLV